MVEVSNPVPAACSALGRTFLGAAVRHGRGMPVHALAALRRRGRGPRVAFLPSKGRQGASLLRIYNMARALRPFGWQCLVLPWKLTLDQRLRILGRFAPDILVMQGVRHDQNRPWLYPGCPVVCDMDDADFHLAHLAGPLERSMPQVAGVIAGSRYVADWCRGQGASADVVWTTTPPSRRFVVPQRARAPVVAWAQTAPANYAEEADWVCEVMRRLSRAVPDVRLRLYDRKASDDPAFLARFRAAGIRTEWRQSTCYSDYIASFDDVSLGLAPLSRTNPFSRGKSFGKILAYLDRRVPVIGSDAGEHGAFFRPGTGVISNDMAEWVDAAAALLADAEARRRMSDRAYLGFRSRLSIPAGARQTDRVLRQYLP